MKNKKQKIILALFVLFLFFSAMFSLCSGSEFFSPVKIFGILSGKIAGADKSIFLYSRVPRTFGALVCGAALATSGAVLQSVFSNKLASPSIVGVNAGAGFGVTLCTAFGLLNGFAVSAFAFLGSAVAVGVISLFATKTNASRGNVILCGVAVNSIFSALSESISVLDEDVATLTLDFRIGGFASASKSRLFPVTVITVITLLLLFTLFNELDVLSLGEENAKSLGLNSKKYRVIFLILAALLAGTSVSFCGLLSFVGLVVPQFVRKIFGNESKKLLPLCALVGSGFVCFCDTLSRILFVPYELPVGIILSFVGCPIFILMLVKMRGGHKNA